MRDALRYGMPGEEILSARCTGVAWELARVRGLILRALKLAGQGQEFTRRLEKILHDVEGNDDRYTECALLLSVGDYIRHLVADDPAAARRELDEKIAQWARPEFDIPACLTFMAALKCCCTSSATLRRGSWSRRPGRG